jgi:hypothetical protein
VAVVDDGADADAMFEHSRLQRGVQRLMRFPNCRGAQSVSSSYHTSTTRVSTADACDAPGKVSQVVSPELSVLLDVIDVLLEVE